jgi:porphobilinogen synthase
MEKNEKDFHPDRSAHHLHSSMVHPLLREWNSVDMFKKSDLIYPIFIHENDTDRKQEITLLPENYRYHHEDIVEVLKPLYEKGLRSVMLFGVVDPDKKDATGSSAFDGPVNKAVIAIKKEFEGKMLVVCDLCLCPYTDHGHCGVLNEKGDIINKKSVIRLGEIALNLIKDGADVIAPSD